MSKILMNNFFDRHSLSRYMEAFRDLVGNENQQGVKELDPDVSLENLERYYEVFWSILPYIKERGEILMENYVINKIVNNCKLYDGPTTWASYIELVMNLFVIKNFLIAAAYADGEIDDEKMIKIISLYSREFSHQGGFANFFNKAAELIELDSLGGLYILLHE